MSKQVKMAGIYLAVMAVLAAALIGGALVFAQDPDPPTDPVSPEASDPQSIPFGPMHGGRYANLCETFGQFVCHLLGRVPHGIIDYYGLGLCLVLGPLGVLFEDLRDDASPDDPVAWTDDLNIETSNALKGFFHLVPIRKHDVSVVLPSLLLRAP